MGTMVPRYRKLNNAESALRRVSYNRLSLLNRISFAFDENIYQLRLDKLKQIEALGQRVYPTKYDFTHAIPQILRSTRGKMASNWRHRG